ncbi:hypothetical protein chiPu_0012359 [Chiloscyllium punctatum]|uniref:Uncharacterized protein n=1 Tax=Chiloscyllium punctatum TaxID=137246 RepID=A0A401SU42_CHIPU|nr:hypothetical protein [Chiloscyllium punctatum]
MTAPARRGYVPSSGSVIQRETPVKDPVAAAIEPWEAALIKIKHTERFRHQEQRGTNYADVAVQAVFEQEVRTITAVKKPEGKDDEWNLLNLQAAVSSEGKAEWVKAGAALGANIWRR